MSTHPTADWFLILNPHSGNGRALRGHAQLAQLLGAEGLSYEIAISEAPGDPVRLTQKALSRGFRNIAAVGGDGTLHQVVNGIFSMAEIPTGEVTLGLIPVGTGNDWARDVGIPKAWPAAIALLAAGHTAWQDIGQIEGAGIAGDALPPGRVWFMNVAGIGFDAFVVEQLHRQRSGRLVYLWGAISNLARFEPVSLGVRIDGLAQGTAKSFALFMALRRYCGQGMLVAPGAIADDGLLDAVWVHGMPRKEVLWNLRRLYDGSLLTHPKVRHFRTARLSLEAPPHTPIEADGELIGHTVADQQINVQILPRALRVIAPEQQQQK